MDTLLSCCQWLEGTSASVYIRESNWSYPFIESTHVPNENRIAFWLESHAAVDAFLPLLQQLGAKNIEGPEFEDPGYYAIFFEDPFGNRLEVCHRLRN